MNQVTTTPWYKSPTTLIGWFITFAGLFTATGLCPPSWKQPMADIVFIMAGLGFHALKAVAVDAGNQAANRMPGDKGLKVPDGDLSTPSPPPADH